MTAGRRRGRGFLYLLLTLLLVAAVCVTVAVTVFSIRHVSVRGNYRTPAEDILKLAGLDRGGNWLTVSEDRIRAGISSNRYLVFVSLERIFPDAVTITVRERTPVSYLSVQGRNYTLDEEGFVLEEYCNTAVTPLQLRGINAREVHAGAVVTAGNRQLEGYATIARELIEQSAVRQFTELNLTDLNNIYLITAEGFVANLGTSDEIRAKLLTLRGVLQYMQANGIKGGTLDVTVPGYCTYTPL